MANEDVYDAAVAIMSNLKPSISSGHLMTVEELPYLDVEKPWWTESIINASSVMGKRFMLFGDILWNDKSSIWTIYFNKRLAEEGKLGDIYALVREGKWTLDKMEEHCQDITVDLDGNGVLDYTDQWGVLGSNNTALCMLFACGINSTEPTEEGMRFSLGDASQRNALDKLYTFINGSNKMLRAENINGVSSVWTEIVNVFREGRGLYSVQLLKEAVALRDMEDDFGIIPLPKIDENQSQYSTTYQAWNARCYTVPRTVADPKRNSIILEYMAYVSRDTMRPAFYDISLQGKAVRDAESQEMLDLIIDNITIDIGLALQIGSIREDLVAMMNASSNTISSTLAKNADAIQKEMDKYCQMVQSIE
jgi:hypothetical protein